MASAWEFPTSINVNGRNYDIRTDYRAVLDVLTALSDPDLSDEDPRLDNWIKSQVILEIIYVDWESIPPEDYTEAIQKASDFIDMGIKDDTYKPKTMDWEQDAPLIVPAINKVLGKEIRAEKYLHWWTFLGAYMEIGDGVFSNVLAIRAKKAKGKKLEKWETEFYRENKKIIDLTQKLTEEEKEEKARLNALLNGGIHGKSE